MQSSNGDYHYTYDAVGNRLSRETMANGLLSMVNYQYDSANRLTSVDNVNYTFDDNGNLLSDGTNTYSYDSANRLIAISGQQSASYTYNGLGDRLSQTVNSETTNYTLDMNSGLTQVLDDEVNSYTYGLGRISQLNTDTLVTDYFLGDALGSVRQMTNSTGDITLAKSYDPYGNVTHTTGTAQTTYGFTSETTDVSGLVYLRARYYSPLDGRFMSRDPFRGIYTDPFTLNYWGYAHNNPVLLTDPTGHCDLLCIAAILIAAGILTGCSASNSTPLLPTVTSFVGIADAPIVLAEDYNNYMIHPSSQTIGYPQHLYFGDIASNKNGIVFFASLNVPSGLDGTIEWVQNIKADVKMEGRDGTSENWGSNGQWVLDDEPIYPNNGSIDITPNFSGDVEMVTEDTPHIPLYSRLSRVTLKEYFQMYLMWHPRGASYDQRIPLQRMEWQWEVTVENQAGSGSDWRIVTSNWQPNPNGSGLATSQMPVLSPNIFDFDYPLP